MTQKVNCSVRGETWEWPLNDSDLPDIPPWDPDHGRLLACKVLTAGATAKVGYAEEMAFVAWEDDSGGEHLGVLTESGNWSSWTISGNTDFVGIAGLSANKCLLAYEDRFYVINTSTPAVEYEYALWSASAGWEANACVAAYDFVALPLIHPGDTWTGMFMMVPKSYDGTDEYFCAGVLNNTSYIQNSIRAIGNGGMYIQGIDSSPSNMAWVNYSSKSASMTLGFNYDDVATAVIGQVYGANAFFASTTKGVKADVVLLTEEQTALGESYVGPDVVRYVPISNKLILTDGSALLSMTPDYEHGVKTEMSGFIPIDLYSSYLAGRLVLAWKGSGLNITISTGLFETSSCETTTRSAITTTKATIPDKPTALPGANTYTVSGSLASPSTSKPLSFSAD